MAVNLINSMALAVRLKFTAEEDSKLMTLVQKLGQSNWQSIASYMNGRTNRQCKERWVHYLDPNIVAQPWTRREDRLLEQKVSEVGKKWKQLEALFPGRTEISLKNRYNVLLRKTTREVRAALGLPGKTKRERREGNAPESAQTEVLASPLLELTGDDCFDEFRNSGCDDDDWPTC
jgi:hypothetical protein